MGTLLGDVVAYTGSSGDAGGIIWVALGSVDILDDVWTGPGPLGCILKAVRTTHELGSGSVPTQDKPKQSEERSLRKEPVLSTAVFPRVQTWFVSGYLLSLYTNQIQDKR